jgi:exodeoxyribonuclease III
MAMRIATYNVNGINRRLANLLGWLEEAAPDIVCLQELKAPDEKFPAAALRAAGYGAIWHGQKSWNGVAILARGDEPVETRRGLPGDPDDTNSRYIEAAVSGLIVGCLYLPNGNPAPGPKFNYKLRWFERLTDYAETLLKSGSPAVLAGDFNVMRTTWMFMRLSAGSMTPCSGRRCARPIAAWSRRAGPTRCGCFIRASGSIRSGNIFGTLLRATPACASITCC